MRSVVVAAFIVIVNGCATTGATPRTDQQTAGYDTNPGVEIGLRRDPALASLIDEVSTARIRETDSVLV